VTPSAPPQPIPFDAQGAPDLQALVRLCGEQYAKSIGENYDPEHCPHHGGYRHISAADWRAWDEAVARWQVERRAVLGAVATVRGASQAESGSRKRSGWAPSPRRARNQGKKVMMIHDRTRPTTARNAPPNDAVFDTWQPRYARAASRRSPSSSSSAAASSTRSPP
jgi:hypothetical protein